MSARVCLGGRQARHLRGRAVAVLGLDVGALRVYAAASRPAAAGRPADRAAAALIVPGTVMGSGVLARGLERDLVDGAGRAAGMRIDARVRAGDDRNQGKRQQSCDGGPAPH